MDNFYESLAPKIKKENILLNEPMKKHTSFRVGGKADYYIYVENTEELKFLLEKVKEYGLDYYIVGNGTNLLVKDNGFRGVIIRLKFENISIDNTTVTVGCGVSLTCLAKKLYENSKKGFENLSGIPGTIGGAVKMNAGAYGTEIKDILVSTKYLDENRNINTLKLGEHQFKYRNSVFSKNKWIILESTFKIEDGDKKEIREIMEDIFKRRIDTQPLNLPNAGSTFKRGEGFVTAQLIDMAGLKGYKIGDAQISEKHAGFVVNLGNATAEDIIKLIKYTKYIVKQKFDKEIFEEIVIIGG